MTRSNIVGPDEEQEKEEGALKELLFKLGKSTVRVEGIIWRTSV
jgi:hypothetical protein